MQGFDLSTAQDIRLGSTSVSAVYLGNQLIWPSAPHDYSQDYFTIVSEADNNTIILTAPIDDPINPTGYNYSLVNLLYSTDNGSTWIDWSTSSAVRNISLNNGDKVLFKGVNAELYIENVHYYYTIINGTKAHRVEGNIASLMFGDNYIGQTQPSDILCHGGFRSLLSRDTTLTSAENLILPFTRLVGHMYQGMFYGCTSLITAPKIISAIVHDMSYYMMFRGCTSLVNVPRIEANLGWVSGHGYTYDQMFENCSSLNYLECMLEPTYTGAFSNWLDGVAATGTFKKSSSYTWPSSLIPSGWTVTNV